jgi:hypothetical protein
VIDVIAIAAVSLAALGVSTFLVVRLLGAGNDLNAARDLYERQRELTEGVEHDRDNLTVLLATERDKTKALQDRLAAAESERNDATRALAGRIAEGIKNAPDAASALSVLNDILSAHLSGTGTTAAHRDGGEAAAVQPSATAGGSEAGRHA